MSIPCGDYQGGASGISLPASSAGKGESECPYEHIEETDKLATLYAKSEHTPPLSSALSTPALSSGAVTPTYDWFQHRVDSLSGIPRSSYHGSLSEDGVTSCSKSPGESPDELLDQEVVSDPTRRRSFSAANPKAPSEAEELKLKLALERYAMQLRRREEGKRSQATVKYDGSFLIGLGV